MKRLFDLLLELRIDLARRHLLRYPTLANAQNYHKLICSRSPSQVARMENGRRLA
jgi:hypothetical protein